MANLNDRRMQQIAGTAAALLKDRRVQLASGAAIALLAGLALAIGIALRPDADDGPPPASEGGLVVQAGHDEIQKLDPSRPLKCYVGGRLAGEMTVADCARKNGVATGALDVGVAPSGGLAASAAPSNLTIPPPPPPPGEADGAAGDESMATADDDASGAAAGRPCYAHAGGHWSRTPGVATLGACVQTLFAGQCEAPGAAVYGRWGNKSLRLVLGKVEISDDGSNFRTLAVQTGACAIPDLG
ncbi:MAG TPA: hypothetical protein VGF42_07895 [Caulobacteraceae bacterium]